VDGYGSAGSLPLYLALRVRDPRQSARCRTRGVCSRGDASAMWQIGPELTGAISSMRCMSEARVCRLCIVPSGDACRLPRHAMVWFGLVWFRTGPVPRYPNSVLSRCFAEALSARARPPTPSRVGCCYVPRRVLLQAVFCYVIMLRMRANEKTDLTAYPCPLLRLSQHGHGTCSCRQFRC